MSHEILKRLGLDHLDASSPDFLVALQRMQRQAWESLQFAEQLGHASDAAREAASADLPAADSGAHDA